MTRYRITIDRFTYDRGVEFIIQCDDQDKQHCVSPICCTADDFNVKLTEVMLKLERRCEPTGGTR
jgi:hypothetical protein